MDGFPKNTQISDLMKIIQREPSRSTRPVGRTDMTKVTVPFRNLLKAPKMWKQAIVTKFMSSSFALRYKRPDILVGERDLLSRECCMWWRQQT